MLTQEAMLNLASELTGADADGDATSLAAIAWRLYREAGENLAEIGRLRAAIHYAWNRPQKKGVTGTSCRLSAAKDGPGLGSRAATRTSPQPGPSDVVHVAVANPPGGCAGTTHDSPGI